MTAFYHFLSVVVVGRCDCNGHGSDCHLNKHPYECVCAPSSYTSGTQCDVCVANSYQVTEHATGAVLQCRPCDCDVSGTIGQNDTCQLVSRVVVVVVFVVVVAPDDDNTKIAMKMM